MKIIDQVLESTRLTDAGGDASTRATEMLERVGLGQERHGAFPHELSGGQRQRVVIAMAVANHPRLLVADEPTTGLDVVTQREILDLLDELRAELGLQLLVISHDLLLLASRTDDLAIMYAGRIVETGPSGEVLTAPRHPYTRLLVRAFPRLDGPPRAAAPIPGEPPEPGDLVQGCAFASRCPLVEDRCRAERPELRALGTGSVACHVVSESDDQLVVAGGDWP